MKGRFLTQLNERPIEGNIFADRSSLILEWLLMVGLNKEAFSLREVAKAVGVSVGLVQRVFGSLVIMGLLKTEGMRTAKKFSFKKSSQLLKTWLQHYSIVRKCKMWTYHSGFQGKAQLLNALKKSNYGQKVELALHSAAEAHGCKNTNLDTLELYLLDPDIRPKLEELLQLQPQERGYEVLLIEPYYKSLSKLGKSTGKNIRVSPALLAFLDLYHFPLRGQEQAEFMAQRLPELKQIL